MFDTKEMKVFAVFLRESMEIRLAKLGDILHKDEKYQKLSAEKMELFKQMVFGKIDEHKRIFINYLYRELEMSNIAQARAYELGFKDVVMLILFAGYGRHELADLMESNETVPDDSAEQSQAE